MTKNQVELSNWASDVVRGLLRVQERAIVNSEVTVLDQWAESLKSIAAGIERASELSKKELGLEDEEGQQ